MEKKYRRGSIVELVDQNPDGTKTTHKARVVSAKTKRYKSGIEWTTLHVAALEATAKEDEKR